MTPPAFRYEPRDGAHSLYIGELSAVAALSLLDPGATLRVTEFGATGYATHGWATEAELPPLATVAALRDFLEQPALGLIELAVEIDGVGRVSWQDDGELHFQLLRRDRALAILTAIVPAAFAGRVIYAVLHAPRRYVTYSTAGVIATYPTFDAYLAATQ